MKKSILVLATAFSLSAVFTSCRDTNKEGDKMEVSDDMDDVADDMEDDMDDVADDVEDAANDAGDAVDNAANDVGDAVSKGANEVENEVEGNDDM